MKDLGAIEPNRLEKTTQALPSYVFEPGETFKQNGLEYRPFPLKPEQNRLDLPYDLPEQSRLAYCEAMGHLEYRAARTISKLQYRLSDARDGNTYAGVEKIIDNYESLDPQFLKNAKGYLISLLNFGGTFNDHRSYVLVPPCTRSEFEEQVSRIDGSDLSGGDWKEWLDHIYTPTPFFAEGKYIFDRIEDFRTFEESLGEVYAESKSELSKLFDDALTRDLSADEWERYEVLSQELVEIQKEKFKEILGSDSYVNALSTRIHVTYEDSEQGAVIVRPVHYLNEFKEELQKLSGELLDAANSLPEWATQTREVLRAQAAWCVDEKQDPEWGRSLSVWVKAQDPKEFLDINLCAEEVTVTPKGEFQLAVCQFIPAPKAIEPAFPTLLAEGRSKGVETIFLNSLIYAGHMERNGVTAGEKLPDPLGLDAYKSMTMVNVSGAGILSNAEKIALTMGVSEEEIKDYIDVPIVGVAYHEFGHGRGELKTIPGNHWSDVEETNAQASGVYLTAIFSPDFAERVGRWNSCFIPIRRAFAGITEQHSRSDIVLVQEYLNAGAIEISEREGGGYCLSVKDFEALYQTAFETALAMRLWERGIPKRLYGEELSKVKFDPSNPNQDSEVINAVSSKVLGESEDSSEALLEEAKSEIDIYFSNERLRGIGKGLKPVMDTVPQTQGLLLFPTDPTIRKMFGISV